MTAFDPWDLRIEGCNSEQSSEVIQLQPSPSPSLSLSSLSPFRHFAGTRRQSYLNATRTPLSNYEICERPQQQIWSMAEEEDDQGDYISALEVNYADNVASDIYYGGDDTTTNCSIDSSNIILESPQQVPVPGNQPRLPAPPTISSPPPPPAPDGPDKKSENKPLPYSTSSEAESSSNSSASSSSVSSIGSTIGNSGYKGRHMVALCAVFLLAFSAVRAIQAMQSSINAKGKLGILALAMFYLSLATGVVFIHPLCRGQLSDRTLLLLGIFLLCLWVPASIVQYPVLLILTAILGGIGLMLTWTAQMNSFDIFFQATKKQSEKRNSLRRFLQTNNLLFGIFQSSHIWGNFIAALLMFLFGNSKGLEEKAVTVKIIADSNESLVYNKTITPGWYLFPPLFNADVKPSLLNKYDEIWGHCKDDFSKLPSDDDWSEMMSIYNISLVKSPLLWVLGWLTVLVNIAFLLALFFFHPKIVEGDGKNKNDDDDDEIPVEDDLSSCNRIQKFIVSHMFQLFDGPHFRLLIPLLFFNGFEQGFLYTDYTRV